MNGFSFSRWWGIVIKEFIQLKRDRLTFGMIIVIPIIQWLLFGFAINSDPKHLPTAVIVADQSEFSQLPCRDGSIGLFPGGGTPRQRTCRRRRTRER